jgi:hypothetical protein
MLATQIEGLAKHVGDLRVVSESMQISSTYLAGRVDKIEELKRPCPEFMEHLALHREGKRRWWDRFWFIALRGVTTAAIGAGIALWAHFIGILGGKP